MPLYEYRCSKCGHQFEVIQKFSDSPKTKCPKCGGLLEKLLSASAIQFKGSGWYVTDYGKDKGRSAKDESSKKSSAPESGDGASGKSDSKPKKASKEGDKK